MTTWTTEVRRANGIDIQYLRTRGDKPPVVLLHGLGGSGATWTPLARALEADFDVVMPDARGHGGSSTPAEGYRYDDLASDAIALIEALDLSSPIVLGHSMGGLTAAVVASRMGGALAGLVLVDPTFLTPERQREVYESDVAEQHRRLLGRERREVLADLEARHPHRSSEIRELIASARLATRIEAFDVLVPPNPDYRRLVREIPVPILLVVAEAGVVSPETATTLQNANSNIRIESISDAGHGVHFDQPEHFAAAVKGFLDSLVAPSSGNTGREAPG